MVCMCTSCIILLSNECWFLYTEYIEKVVDISIAYDNLLNILLLCLKVFETYLQSSNISCILHTLNRDICEVIKCLSLGRYIGCFEIYLIFFGWIFDIDFYLQWKIIFLLDYTSKAYLILYIICFSENCRIHI